MSHGRLLRNVLAFAPTLQIPPVKQLVVHVNVGDKGIKENFEVAECYGIPLEKGVPALMRPES